MPLIWVPYSEFQKARLEHTSTLSRHLRAQLLKAQTDVQRLWYARRASTRIRFDPGGDK